MSSSGPEPDDAWLNDRSEFQQNWVHGLRNSAGLQLQYELVERPGVVAEVAVSTLWIPSDDHVGFPGFAHGGLLSAVLDDAMGRSVALLRRWVVTGRLEVRYRTGAPVGAPLLIQAWMSRSRRRVVNTEGQILLADGTVVAEAAGTYLPVPESMLDQMVTAWPGFAPYARGDHGNG